MKNLLAIFLSLSMLICLSGCDDKIYADTISTVSSETESMSSVNEEASSGISAEVAWEDFVETVQPDIDAVNKNSVEEISRDYVRDEIPDNAYTDIDYLYHYWDNVLESEIDYLEIMHMRGYPLTQSKITSNEDYIKRVAALCSTIELEQLSQEEHSNLHHYSIDGLITTHDTGDTIFFDFFGNGVQYMDIRFHQCNESRNVLESSFSVQVGTTHYRITNFEEIQDEFYEILAIGRCVTWPEAYLPSNNADDVISAQ